jgi:pimeloyl-ACP methyl ester carboxylesterase
MKHDRLRPRRAFLVGPNTEFRFPTWFRPMLRLPAPSYAAIKHLVLWYLRHVKVDVRKEPEQMERYETTLKEAKPDRIKLSAMALSTYSVWPDLETVRVPCAVAWAHSDTLHDAHNIARMLRVLPAATEVRCPSNKHMHDAPVAADMRAFLDA